eukprot:m.541767 g.541767  ORF g.541767 m.541767 type:complete len:138 (+) comp22111_c1_seq28:98-511(+)
MVLGIPVKLLHEAKGHIVTCELTSGEMYRGKLTEVEDNMNTQFAECTLTDRMGRTSQLQHVFIRGNRIRFLVIPDMLRNAPMFKNQERKLKGQAMGAGVGKTAMIRSAVESKGRGGGGRHSRDRGGPKAPGDWYRKK